MKTSLNPTLCLLLCTAVMLSCKDTNNRNISTANSADTPAIQTTKAEAKASHKRIDPEKLATRIYGGTYSYGYEEPVVDGHEGATGAIYLYPETDTTLLFSFNACKGAPSYNIGTTEGRVYIRDGKGYSKTRDEEYADCRWEIVFNETGLSLSTIDEKYDCGFGHNVFADGTFTRTSPTVPLYFIQPQGDTIYFAKFTDEFQ